MAQRTRTRKTKSQLEREIADALADVDRKIASTSVEGGELYWRGRRGSPVVKPHRRTSASCKTCGRFHSTAEHRRHARSGKSIPVEATRTRPRGARDGEGGQGSKKSKKTRRATAAPARRDPLEVVREVVLSAPASDRFGDRKIFISRIWERARSELGMTLSEFKRWLINAHMAKQLQLSRADLVSAMDPELVAASSTIPQGETYPEWHFVVDESK